MSTDRKHDGDPKLRALIQQMAQYPLRPGQMLLLGPRSVAYLTGDYVRAPWALDQTLAPGGRLLPDKHVLDEIEWKSVTAT